MNRKSNTKLKAVFSRIFCFAVYLFLFLPISVVIANSFNATTSKPYLSWKGFTFNWYVKLFENNALLTSFGNTLIIAVVSTVLATAIGTLGAVGMYRYKFRGKGIIDGLLDACLAAGISEIYIVRGYLADQFDQLLYKYPMIRFLENPSFNEANNISSALCARYLLSNAYVFEADLLISNPAIIRRYHYRSDFLGIPTERSDDWCFDVVDGVIRGQRIGGLNCYQMVGISYWNEEDGKKLADHLEEAFRLPGGKELYWDQVPLKIFADRYEVHVLPCKKEDIVEIDTFSELKAIDPAYDV